MKDIHILSTERMGSNWEHLKEHWKIACLSIYFSLSLSDIHGSWEPTAPCGASWVNHKTMRKLWISFWVATLLSLSQDIPIPLLKTELCRDVETLNSPQWRDGERGCTLKNARHLERVPRGCNVPWWPTGCLYPVLSFFYSLQTSLVSFPALSSNDFFIWHSHWRGRVKAFPGHGDHALLLLAGRDDGRAADAAVSPAQSLSLWRLLIHSRGRSAVQWKSRRVNMGPKSRNIGVLT